MANTPKPTNPLAPILDAIKKRFEEFKKPPSVPGA